MNFNFVFISYTVIYAKYSHCYEIPRDLPVRYFDAPRYTNISTELDWADLIKEIKEIELQETTTQIRPTKTKTTENTTTEKTTRKTTTTKKTTTKKITTKTTTKKITTKMTTPKTTVRNICPLTKPTTTTKTAVKHSPFRCKLKLKTTTTTTIDPRIWQMKMLTSEDWINAGTRVRPTKKLYPIGRGFLVNPSHCKLKLETTTATTIDPLIWKMKMITSEDWINVWTCVRPTKKPSPITAKKYTTKNLLATRTKKPATTTETPVTTTKAPVTTTMKPVTTAEKPVELSGIRGDEGNGPENWSNLMREFLKFVELKKCRPPCEYRTTTTMPFSGYMLGEKRIRSGADDLTNILMDGAEIDDKLCEVGNDASQGKASMRFKETYEADTQRLNYDSVEDSVSRDSEINNDNEQDLKSFKDSVKVRRIKQGVETAQNRKKKLLLKELKSKNVKQDYETPQIIQSEAYLDELKDKNAIEEDKVSQDSEINSYLGELKYKEKDSETKAYLDAENARQTGKAQDKDIKKRLDIIKDMHTQKYKHNSQYVSHDPLNFKELNRIADYVATKSTYSTEMINDNEDFLQDRDITFDLGTLEGDHEKADKYSTENIEVRDSDVYAYADTVNDRHEEKDDKTIKSYENVIPLFNFKYALSENMTN